MNKPLHAQKVYATVMNSASFLQFRDRLDRVITTKSGLFLVQVVAMFLAIKLCPTLFLWVMLLLVFVGGISYRSVRLEGNKSVIFLISILISVLSLITSKIFIAETRYVAGSSMEPTLPNLSRFVIDKTSYVAANPRHGEIVVFKVIEIYDPQNPNSSAYQGSSHEVKISRIIGLPGETIEIKNGQLWINGQQQQEPYLGKAQINTKAPYKLRAFKVPRDFLLYKDDSNSSTSKDPHLGLIPRQSLVGKAAAIYAPTEDMKRL